MSSVARSVYYFGAYLLIAGVSLFFFPNQTIGLIGIEPTFEVWIHLVGILTFILGVFFISMARQEIYPFFYVSLFGRAIFILGIFWVVLFYNAPEALLLFAMIDSLGLLWTGYTYKKHI